MFHRLIKLPNKQSFFLFGARGTGKTSLVKDAFPAESTLYIDLLDPEIEARYLRKPSILRTELQALPARIRRVVIDEIQKVPKLLDVVHQQIESTKLQFALTGSSARKLRRGAANLLAGRAVMLNLFPLTAAEYGGKFSLEQVLEFGSLPKVSALKKTERERFLRTYAQTYLKEEVWNEQLVRNLQPFSVFLEIAAQSNGQILNYSKIARDIGVDTKTVQSYFQILEDTLVGFFLHPFHRSIRKRQVLSSKFYLFDTGVKRALDGTLTVQLLPGTYAFGKAFEHFLVAEMLRINSYLELDYRFSFFKTHDGAEIDLVIERPGGKIVLVEIKSTDNISEDDVKTLEVVGADFRNCERFCLSRDPVAKKIGKTYCLYWPDGLRKLGLGR